VVEVKITLPKKGEV